MAAATDPPTRAAFVESDDGEKSVFGDDDDIEVAYNNSEDALVFSDGSTTNDILRVLADGTDTVTVPNVASGSGTTAVFDGSNNLVKSSSSERFKENITAMEHNPDKVLGLQPVEFDFKRTGEHDFGYIAEDVIDIAPELVLVDNQDRPDGVKYDRITVHLLEIVKSHQRKVRELEKELRGETDMEKPEDMEKKNGILDRIKGVFK